MSFGDLERGYGSVTTNTATAFQPAGRGGDQEYIRLNESVRKNITRLGDLVSTYRRTSELLGTAKDSHELRQKLSDLAEDAKELVKSTTADLKLLKRIDGGSATENQQRRIQCNKLSTDFAAVVERFQETQRVVAERERAFIVKIQKDHDQKQERLHDFESESRSDETQVLVQDEERRQQQQVLEQSIEYQEALINERAEGIAVIQRDMAELNSMMKEINSMIIGQQDLVNTIEENINQVAVHTDEGTNQLVDASKYQRITRLQQAARKKMCYILLICVIVLAVIVTVVVVKTT